MNFFYESDLSEHLQKRREDFATKLTSLSNDVLLNNDEDTVCEFLLQDYDFQPLVINPKPMEQNCERTQITYTTGHSFPATRYKVYLTFTGASSLLKMKASRSSMKLVEGEIDHRSDGTTCAVILMKYQDGTPKDKIQDDLDDHLDFLVKNCEFVNTDVAKWKLGLDNFLKSKIKQRVFEIRQQLEMEKALDIPLRRNLSAPAMKAVPLEFRKKIALRSDAKNCAFAQLPELSRENFDYILQVVRHEGRSFERTPKTFYKLDEEELRDVILAHLNGHFLGLAQGEAFRTVGKTDILIPFEGGNAFAAECKNWAGEKSVHRALDQLRGYLTWRDNKSALIIFNKSVGRFTELRKKAKEALSSYDGFLSLNSFKEKDEGEWSIVIRAEHDCDARIDVHVFLFNLHHSEENR